MGSISQGSGTYPDAPWAKELAATAVLEQSRTEFIRAGHPATHLSELRAERAGGRGAGPSASTWPVQTRRLLPISLFSGNQFLLQLQAFGLHTGLAKWEEPAPLTDPQVSSSMEPSTLLSFTQPHHSRE